MKESGWTVITSITAEICERMSLPRGIPAAQLSLNQRNNDSNRISRGQPYKVKQPQTSAYKYVP